MSRYLFTSLVFLLSSATFAEEGLPLDPSSLASTQRKVDYLGLDHTISLAHLRAGNHDDSGTNNYYFVAEFFGLVSNEAERRKPEDQRKQQVFEGGKFGESSLKSLSFLKPVTTDPKLSFQVTGDYIREIVSKTMAEFDVVETDTAVMVEIRMYEENKEYFFFGEDTLVAKTKYYPIPSTKFDAPPKTNVDLNMKDSKGTDATLKVTYSTKDAKSPTEETAH